MTPCGECGTSFDVEEARDEYDAEFGDDITYDEYGTGLCAGCAIGQTNSNMSLGQAILAWNGDDDGDMDAMREYF